MSRIEDNKKEFISIAKSIEREGIDDLLAWLETTDFYTTVASTKYHANYEGGLCEHSLHVYANMIDLRDQFCPLVPDETCKIVALFHDLAKVDFYEEYAQNKKVYSPTGSKSDELGRFDWVSVKGFRTKEAIDRDFVLSEHGVNSYVMLHKYVKLSQSEAAAIINHHAGKDNGYAMRDLNEVFNRYPAATLLHLADMLATYIDENPYIVDEPNN